MYKNKLNLRNVVAIIICLTVTTMLSGCGSSKIFSSPDAKSLAMRHKIIAIIPPTVSVDAWRRLDVKSMKEQQKIESQNFQQEMYSCLLKRKTKGKFFQEIQEIDVTNALLRKADYPEKVFPTNELCKILG